MKADAPDKRNYNPRVMLHDIAALKNRSRMIERLKYSLPGIALLALIVLIGWPQLQKWVQGDKLTLAQTMAQNIKSTQPQSPLATQANNKATRPEYKSSDDNNRPYTITAEQGVETSNDEIHLTHPKMVMNINPGEVVTLTSATGNLEKATNKMHLVGDVTLTHSQGYKIQTTQAWIDCNEGSAYGNDPVWGDGPAGSIAAKGFRMVDRGAKVSFIGGSQLLLTSGGKKE